MGPFSLPDAVGFIISANLSSQNNRDETQTMTTCRPFRQACVLAVILACILLATVAAAQEEVQQEAQPTEEVQPAGDAQPGGEPQLTEEAQQPAEGEQPSQETQPAGETQPTTGEARQQDAIASLFEVGMRARAAAEEAEDEETRQALYDAAIQAFRRILVNNPQLVRVRLELALTFFQKGQDGLARRHFELVLAGGVPVPVAENIRRFLQVMRARKRWSGYFGAAFAPDSNLNAASNSEVIYIDTVFGRLPFQREGDFGARSGLGLSVWGGGEYQQPVTERLRLRVGADLAQREYGGKEFDQYFLSTFAGPRLLAGRFTDLSLLATAQRQWLGAKPYVDETGGRLEIDRRLGARVWARGTAAYRDRDCHGCDFRDGPLADFTFNLFWTTAPTLQVHMAVGYERDHSSSVHWRNIGRWVRVGTSLALPLGFTLGTSAQMRRTYYDGSGAAHLTLHGRQRRDRTATFSISILNRAFTLFRFSPQLAVVHESRRTNAQAQSYKRDRAELRLIRQF